MKLTAQSIYTIARYIVACILAISFTSSSYAQTSLADGDWYTGANWTGGSAPNPDVWPTINVGHQITRAGDYTVGGTLNVNSSGDLTLNGNVSVVAGANINVYGLLTITGNVYLESNLNIFPGGKVIVEGTIRVSTHFYLNVGNADPGPPYADLVVKTNLTSVGGGKSTINNNGRVAVYGDFNNEPPTGDSRLILNDGAQVFIYGDIHLTGSGGDDIINSNSGDYNGLYVGGNVDIPEASGSILAGPDPDPFLPIEELPADNDPFFQWLLEQPDIPIDETLPVELTSFLARQEGSKLTLVWETASEQNNDYFTVERSFDGRNFSPVAQIPGSGNTLSPRAYRWELAQAHNKLLYYRLRQTDYDGKYEYIGLVSVYPLNDYNDVQIFPNPVAAGDEIRIDLGYEAESSYEMCGFDGRIARSGTFKNSTILSTAGITPGVYVLAIYNGSQKSFRKIIIN